MAFYSGSAVSYNDLLTKFLAHAQADGWTLSGSVLSKGGAFATILETATSITIRGCTDSLGTGPAPNEATLGRVWQRTGYPTVELVFPVSYRVFSFSDELYLIVTYDVDKHQWLAMGKTDVPGLLGTGTWFGATGGPFAGNGYAANPFLFGPTRGGSPSSSYDGRTICPGMFWYGMETSTSQTSTAGRNCYSHHGLDNSPWELGVTDSSNSPGPNTFSDLLGVQPNLWNSDAVLVPIRQYKYRPSNKISLVCELKNARHIRCTNFASGEILTIGPDKWMVFPWFLKNTSVPDASGAGGSLVNHTGTYGWAIRYEGP